MKRKLLTLFLVFGMVLSCAGCGGNITDSSDGYSESESKTTSNEDSTNMNDVIDEKDNNVFKDRHYKAGFTLTNTAASPGPTYIGNLQYGGVTAQPRWNLAQWCTKYLIQPTDVPEEKDGWYIYKNESKEIRVNPEEGAIYLECNASKEFDAPRVEMQDWPHLLIEQYTTERCPDLSKISSLRLQMEFTIDKLEKKMTAAEFNAGLHTAQFQINFTLSNQNKKSPGYNDCIWFGMQFLDDRYPYSNDVVTVDGGKESATGLAMYGVSSKKFLSEPVWVGDRVYIDFDILPEIKNALKAVREYDVVKVFQNTELADLKLTTMNLGWELPGTYDVASTIYSLDLIYED